MSNINDYLDYISTANYGSDVREAIVSSIRECYKDATGHPDSVAALVQEYIDREEKIDGAVTALTGLYNSLGEIVYSYDYNNNISGIHISENDEFGCVDQITLGPGKWIIKVVSFFSRIINASPDVGTIYLSFSNTLDSDGFPIPLNDTYNYKDDLYYGTILKSAGSHINFIKMIELTEERTIYMWIQYNGLLSEDTVVSPYMTAMRIGESTPSDGTSLADQVVENTAEIASINETVSDIQAELQNVLSSGLSDDAKQALLSCFQNVAWINDYGKDYYDALEFALYPTSQIVSISAVFTQPSKNVYDDWTYDDLKEYLVVTAHHDDYSTQTIRAYTLSGTLSVGESTITVTYGGEETTFDVTVSAPLYSFTTGTHTFTNPAGTIEVINGNTGVITSSTANSNDTHANFSNLSSNTSACNSTNNYAKDGSTAFTIPAGSTVKAKTIINSYANCPSTMKIGSALRAFSGDTLLTQMMLVEDTLLNTISPGTCIESTATFNAETVIGCVGMWFGVRSNNYVAASINVSYAIYVGDVRYI